MPPEAPHPRKAGNPSPVKRIPKRTHRAGLSSPALPTAPSRPESPEGQWSSAVEPVDQELRNEPILPVPVRSLDPAKPGPLFPRIPKAGSRPPSNRRTRNYETNPSAGVTPAVATPVIRYPRPGGLRRTHLAHLFCSLIPGGDWPFSAPVPAEPAVTCRRYGRRCFPKRTHLSCPSHSQPALGAFHSAAVPSSSPAPRGKSAHAFYTVNPPPAPAPRCGKIEVPYEDGGAWTRFHGQHPLEGDAVRRRSGVGRRV